jgi:hypothetical protein
MLSLAMLGPFLSPIIGAGTAYVMMRINRSYSETKEQRGVREAEEKAAKARIDGLARELDDQKQALRQAEVSRVQERLNYEKDFAAITNILKENTDSQRQTLTFIANVGSLKENSDRHERQFEKIDRRLEEINHILLELHRRHVNP